ncbi:MAG: PAS domain S-box protein [Blastocatellia bacterium]|nr:PAS domain S-box protein [Blastocatellia bacterium]
MKLLGWKFRDEEEERQENARKLHEAAWPDMFANLQSAYTELTNAQFELERRTAEIAETRDLFQHVVSSMSEALFLTDRSGRVIRINPAAANLLEYPETAIIGRPLRAVCGTEKIPATPWKLMELAPTGRLPNLEVDIRTMSGLSIPVSFSLSLMQDKQNKITGVLAVARDMRENRSLINSLVAARTRFQELLEFAPDAIVLANQEGRIVLVNSQTEKLFGMDRQELLGQPVDLLLPESTATATGKTGQLRQLGPTGHLIQTGKVAPVGPTGQLEQIALSGQLSNVATSAQLKQVDESEPSDSLLELDDDLPGPAPMAKEEAGVSGNVEFSVIRRNGREFLAEITRRQIVTEDGLIVMSQIRDITEREQMAAALHESEERYRIVAETASDVILTVDEEITIQYVNSAVEKIFGYLPSEIIGQKLTMLMHCRDRSQLWGQAGIELMGWHKDGRDVPVEVSFSEFVKDGRQSFTGIVRDITERKKSEVERKRIEEERAQLLSREQEARQVAEDANRLKDDFLAMISHELRAPLTAILGWAQMLRSGTLDRASVDRALLTIERNAKTQAHLVGDLLDASRIATGKLNLEIRPVELMSIVEAAVDAVRPMVEAKELRMQIVLEPWVGPFNGDIERLKQIVWNLLSNAIKFTPPGGLIEVRLERLENKALLIVSDTGQGIDPEFLPKIFDRFRQGDSSSRRQQGGLGLGLAIIKHLVELHGGAIYAYSRGIGQGSDFMITLPLGTQQGDVEAGGLWPIGQEKQTDTRASSLRGAKVLVVDDDHDTREILSVMLTRYGTEVRAAGSAAEAMEVLAQWKPDVLVSDIGMPIEDGYALIRKVRALPAEEGGEVPAVALTAFAGAADKDKALAAGFQQHLGKPVEPVQLAKVVARILGRSDEGITL